MADPASSIPEPGAPNPGTSFAYPSYRLMWAGTAAANVSLWVTNVAAAWLMVTLTPSVLMIALVQSAATLPAFLFSLPSGVLGDLLDRKRLLLVTHAGMLLSAVLLALLYMLGLLGPWTLLLLTFALGSFSAVTLTVQQAVLPDLVPRPLLVQALVYMGVAFSGARAVGPALAGFMLAMTGIFNVFLAASALFAMATFTQARQQIPARLKEAHPERWMSAMRSGVRFVRHEPVLKAYLIRITVNCGMASALWALLPVVANNHRDFGASGYGVMLGILGIGAVIGALASNALRARYSLDRLISLGTLAWAATAIGAALLDHLIVLCAMLLIAGASWITVNSNINAAFQTSLPVWVRARGFSVFLLVFQGALAIGGAIWGVVASWIGTDEALILSGIGMAAGLFVMRRDSVRLGDEADYKPSQHWPAAEFPAEPELEDGPVAIQLDYRIDGARRDEFIDAMFELGVVRKRTGARRWQLYRDLHDANQYAERFVVESWAEHLRQQARATVADQATEQRVLALHVGEPVKVSYFIAESGVQRPADRPAQ